MKAKTLFVVGMFLMLLTITQVSAASCIDMIESKKTSDFMLEIPGFNANLDGVTCVNKVPVFKNERVNVQIAMTDGSTQEFSLTIQKGFINSIKTGAVDRPSLLMRMGECEFDTILRNTDKGGAFAYLYLQKKVELKAFGFFKKIKLGIAKMVMGQLLKKIQTPVDIACT